MTAMAGRECLHSHALTWGNGYAEKVFNQMGEIVQLWPIPPNRVTKVQMEDGIIYYDAHAGHTMMIDGHEYTIILERDVVVVE